MLGTLCFEWDDGKWETEWMLDGVLGYDTMKIGDVGVEFWVEKLAQIAHDYGFDGYLMNFEAELTSVWLVEKLYLFLTLLRSALKSLVGEHAEVIWYDSVDPVSGKVRW